MNILEKMELRRKTLHEKEIERLKKYYKRTKSQMALILLEQLGEDVDYKASDNGEEPKYHD